MAELPDHPRISCCSVNAFGLSPDLWRGHYVKTVDVESAAALVDAAVRVQALVSIIGPSGMGKTTAVDQALAGSRALVVEMRRPERERLHMGDIMFALVRVLSSERETPRRSEEARRASASSASRCLQPRGAHHRRRARAPCIDTARPQARARARRPRPRTPAGHRAGRRDRLHGQHPVGRPAHRQKPGSPGFPPQSSPFSQS